MYHVWWKGDFANTILVGRRQRSKLLRKPKRTCTKILKWILKKKLNKIKRRTEHVASVGKVVRGIQDFGGETLPK
jgi:hypothetical protein